MKKICLKIIAAGLVLAMGASIAACGKKGGDRKSRSGEKISANSPWFNADPITVDIGLESGRAVDYLYHTLIGADKEKILVETTGSYQMPEALDWDNYNYNDYLINIISVVDRSTKQTVNKIDLAKGLTQYDYVETARYENGRLKIIINTSNSQTYELTGTEKELDIMTGEVISSRTLDWSKTHAADCEFVLGDYRVSTEMIWEEDGEYYNLYIVSPDNEETVLELRPENISYYDIGSVIQVDESKALVVASTSDGYRYFDLDLKECRITDADEKDYEWLNPDYLSGSIPGGESVVYYVNPVGVTKLDFKKKTSEMFFDYSWCGLNRSILSILQVADCSEDSLILWGDYYAYSSYSYGYEPEFKLYEVTKADKNPHAGKTILELYLPYGSSDEATSEAILKFNETNGDCYIEVTDRYDSYNQIDYSSVDSNDDLETASLDSSAKMSSALAVDILNGEGPDILLNCAEYGQLNNENYLADLSSYIGTPDPDKYFVNIIEGSKTDGKLYQLPLTYQIEGIHTASQNAGSSGVGFTTEEYEKFLNETLNGKDVIDVGQAIYFSRLFSNMRDKFIVNGKVDFSGPEFAAIARFVNENVPERSPSWSDSAVVYETATYAVGASMFKGDPYGYETPVAYNTMCAGMGSYLIESGRIMGETSILGFPSSDGRGPVFTAVKSIAISAQAADAGACGEFVKLLMGSDSQRMNAMNDCFVLDRQIFRECAKVAIEYYNSQEGFGYFGDPGNTNFKFTEAHIDAMERIILSCSGAKSTDSAINLILIEEMPSYFSGQKDLAAVAAIAQDRVQKVIDERG